MREYYEICKIKSSNINKFNKQSGRASTFFFFNSKYVVIKTAC